MVRRTKTVKVKTPTGKTVLRARREKPSYAKCAKCNARLHGMPKLHPIEQKRIPKSKRVPNRPYGGYLCTKCTRETFKEKVKTPE